MDVGPIARGMARSHYRSVILSEDAAMWDLLFALAQVVSVLVLVAGFLLINWYAWSRYRDDRLDD
jgi:hypothetical protein